MSRPLAALLSVLIACPPSAWAGASKSISLPSLGTPVRLPALGISNPGLQNLAPVVLPEIQVGKLPTAPSAVVPGAVPVAVQPGMIERLAEPMGDWAQPQASGGKAESSSDFERRAFGAVNNGSSGTPVDPPSGSGSAPQLPPSNGGGPHIVVLVRVNDAGRDATISRLSKQYGFKLDYGFKPVVDGVTSVYRGLLPMQSIPLMARDPEVLQFGPAVGRIQSLSLEPYRTPEKRESLLRWTFRELLTKAEPAAMLAMIPFALGTLLVAGPFVAAFSIPAAASPVLWAVIAGGAMTAASITPFQNLIPKAIPPIARFSVGPVLQAAGGLWLAFHAAPVLGALAVVNAALGGVAAARVFLPLKTRSLGHHVERSLVSTELSALITGLSAGLTSLALAASGSDWAAHFGAAALVTLGALALPGPKSKAPVEAAASAADQTLSPETRIAVEYGDALENIKTAEKRRGRALYASAAAMVFAPLSLAGAMKAMALGWFGMPVLTVIAYSLIAICLAIMAKFTVELVRIGKARSRLWAAAAAVNRAAGARSREDVQKALRNAEALALSLKKAGARRPVLLNLVAGLNRVADKLTDQERGDLSTAEAALADPAKFAPQNVYRAAAARRRVLAADGSLTPEQAAEEDGKLDAFMRELSQEHGLGRDAQQELDFVAARLDALYEESGPLDPRKLALARSAVSAYKWAEFGRGRTFAGKKLMVLEALLKRQARNPDTDAETRKAQARAILENVLAAFNGADKF